MIRQRVHMTWLPLLLVTAIVLVGLDAEGQEKQTDKANTKPIQVYILAGQSNMLEMGNLDGGNRRHSGFYQSASPDAPAGVAVSVYEGAYDPNKDYRQLTAKETKVVIYDGLAKDPFPQISGDATYVARGYIEVKTTGVYSFSPGYQGSTYNFLELNGREVYRKEPNGTAQRSPMKLQGGKRYPFTTTFFTKDANSLFWIGRTDIPGTLETVLRSSDRFGYLRSRNDQWIRRDDVLFQDARLHGGWDWDPQDPNRMRLDETKLTNACRPLTIEKGVWVGIPFGCLLGDFHDEQVLIIRTAIGNRGLAWDFRPPSSGKLPDVRADLKKWEGAEYKMMVGGVRSTLKNIDAIVPNYAGQGFEIAGFVWFQGHKDTGNPQWANAYEENLVNLIKDVRSEFETPNLPVVIGTVGFEGRNMQGGAKTVWEAQMAVGKPNRHPELAQPVHTVDTRDFWKPKTESPSGQGYHYNRNAETYLLIGESLGKAMIDLLRQE